MLVESRLADYCVNPYSGCEHACKYCYVPRMPWNKKRAEARTGKELPETWASDSVSVKINASEVLEKELRKARPGTVMVSTSCDAWQPAEEKYGVTRKCLVVLAEKDFPLVVLTKSPLVLRDASLLKKFSRASIGFTVSTDDDAVAAALEPKAAPPSARIEALDALKKEGLETYAFIGPLLPLNAARLAEKLAGKIDYAFIDRLNYVDESLTRELERLGLSDCAKVEWSKARKQELEKELARQGIEAKALF